MENLDSGAVFSCLEKIFNRIIDYRDRTTISWHRYKEVGANLELCGKIIDLYHLLLEQGNRTIADNISSQIICDFKIDVKNSNKDKFGYVIPYTMNIDSLIYILTFNCAEIIFPLKESSNETIRNLVISIENELNNIRKDCKEYIFEEPFSTKIDPNDYSDICQDVAPIAGGVYSLECFTATYFSIAFTCNEDICSTLVYSALNEISNYFRSYDCATALDAYNLAQQLPRAFVRAFFYTYEQDPLRYSQLLSSLSYGDAREFVERFHESDFKLFRKHYYFLRLALAYFELFSQQTNLLPNISDYMSKEYEFPYTDFAQYLISLTGEAIRMMDQDDKQIPEMSRDLSDSNAQSCANEADLISQIKEQTNKDDYKSLAGLEQLDDLKSVCYVSYSEINKKYDVNKLVSYLTSTNEYTDIIFVEKDENDEYDEKDCLTYFFHPYDETIRRKIREKSFRPYFKLEWKGRHAVSLKCLVRLLLNTKEWNELKDVFDSTEDDRLSRKNVSIQDDKSPIWKPVITVFGKNAICNASIDKKSSQATIEKNEAEIKAIINIVLACKK